MVDPLAPLLAEGIIDDVVARLKSGKEADLWLVRHGGEIVAAKVYKARDVRSFKNNAGYKEGRKVRNTRTQRAMDRGSRFGQAATEEAWKAKEADALHTLHAAGVRVPKPVMFYEGVLLMEVIVDDHGHPAPRLIDAKVPREHAASLYEDLRGQAIRMLCCDLVHGDLSPYNVLLGSSGPVVIDFPQVVGAAHNSQAEQFFQRDIQNLHHFFAALDPALQASGGDGREIWRAYVRRELTPSFVPTGRSPPPPPPRSSREHRPHAGGAPEQGSRPPEPPPRSNREHRPHAGGAPEQGSRPPERRDSPGGAPPRHAPPRRAGPPPSGARPVAPSGAARHARGGTDPRRRDGPMPEVIRVGRPPIVPASAPSQAPHGTHPAPQGQPGGQPRGHRRRRRRR
jgi:RIO kinase 1